MWSEYNLLVYMLIFDAIMGITVPVEFILHEIRYQRELRERSMSPTALPVPQRPRLRWPLIVILCAGLCSTFAFVIYTERPGGSVSPSPSNLIVFVKNEQIATAYTRNTGPQDAVTYRALLAHSGEHLRAFVEFQPLNSDPSAQPSRISLGEISHFNQDSDWVLQVISRTDKESGGYDFWWGNPVNRIPFSLDSYRARILITDDTDHAQHFYFLILTMMMNDTLYPNALHWNGNEFEDWEKINPTPNDVQPQPYAGFPNRVPSDAGKEIDVIDRAVSILNKEGEPLSNDVGETFGDWVYTLDGTKSAAYAQSLDDTRKRVTAFADRLGIILASAPQYCEKDLCSIIDLRKINVVVDAIDRLKVASAEVSLALDPNAKRDVKERVALPFFAPIINNVSNDFFNWVHRSEDELSARRSALDESANK